MNHQELLDLIDSGNIAAAQNYLSTLASNNSTPYLNLNQWKSSDKPVMKDFNEDNEKIDAGFRVLSETKVEKSNIQKFTDFGIYGSEVTGNFTYETGSAGYKIIDGMVLFGFGFVVSKFLSAGAAGELRMKLPFKANGAINWGQSSMILNGIDQRIFINQVGGLVKEDATGSTSTLLVSDLKRDRFGLYGQIFYAAA